MGFGIYRCKCACAGVSRGKARQQPDSLGHCIWVLPARRHHHNSCGPCTAVLGSTRVVLLVCVPQSLVATAAEGASFMPPKAGKATEVLSPYLSETGSICFSQKAVPVTITGFKRCGKKQIKKEVSAIQG